MARRAVEETEETSSEGRGRGPSILHQAMADWLGEVHGVKMTAEQVRAAQNLRREFRESDHYQQALEEIEEARTAAEEAREARRQNRAAREQPAEEEAKPKAKKAGRKTVKEATEDLNGAVKKTVRKKAPAAANTVSADGDEAEAEAAPAKRVRRKAPF